MADGFPFVANQQKHFARIKDQAPNIFVGWRWSACAAVKLALDDRHTCSDPCFGNETHRSAPASRLSQCLRRTRRGKKMAYWGPPFVDEGAEARLACLAALDMTARVAKLRKDLPELIGVRSIPAEFDLRIGVATGEALVGSIGSEFMMSYTVMGDTVNLASRLEGANREYGSRSLISESTVAAAGAEIEVREIDRLVVAGQTQSTAVFEIMGRQGELAPKQLLLRTRYSEGLAAYRACQWDEARRAFDAALEAVPGDGPSSALVRRVDFLQANPPPTDWNGSWRLDQK